MKNSFIEYLIEQGFYGRNINSADLSVYGQKKSIAAKAEDDKVDDDKDGKKKPVAKKTEPKNHPYQKLSTYLSIVSSTQ